MNQAAATVLMISQTQQLGTALFLVAVSFFTVAVGILVIPWGFKNLLRMAGDQSLSIGGFYVRNLPYKGYKRFHYRKWNMQHMP